MLALVAYPFHRGPAHLTVLMLLGAFVVLSIVWSRYGATWLARHTRIQFAGMDTETTWRVAGTAALMFVLLAPAVAFAVDPVVPNPCETCRAIWPEWMCFLDCLLFG